jgi:polyisoprenoid-binding protein YceI
MDQKNIAQSKVYFEVDTATVDTRNTNRDSTLRSADFFDAGRHPKMTFRSVAVSPRGDGVANVTGDLTIRGITKRVTVPVRLLGTTTRPRPMAGFETSFIIDRRAFGLTGGRWTAAAPGVLANEVTIHIRAGGVAK